VLQLKLLLTGCDGVVPFTVKALGGEVDLSHLLVTDFLSLQAKRRQVGADSLGLLEWLEPLGAEIREAKGVALLREVFAQQYEVEQSGKIEPVKVHATGVVQNPHDPDAQWSAKGQGKQKKEWVGYKVQVAETVGSQPDPSSFITLVVTQRATQSDDAGLPATLQKQQALGLERPKELYADGAYVSGKAIDQAKEEGWELMGPAQPSASRAGLEKQYRIEAFDISITERKVTEDKSGKITYRFEFGRQCHDCAHKAGCVPSAQREELLLPLVDRVLAHPKILGRLLRRLATAQIHLHGLALKGFIVLL